MIDRLIATYQKWISPALGSHCRFAPSCSDYMREAIRKKGILRGTALGLWRLLKCQPFHMGGWDPVRS